MRVFVTAALVGAVLALATISNNLNSRLAKLEDHTAFLTQWVLLQKMRADQIECGMGNPFGRVDCDKVFQ